MLRATVKMLKSTHRHPANRALHAAGLPIYAYGIAMIISYFAGAGTTTTIADALLGLGLWAVAVSMFVAGHAIEGNVRSMTPVLLARLVSRSLHHLAKQRVHLLR
ncbi:hypothetical protein [Nitrososphaera viennensis]|uniref:Uncharacterized protein n=2 Tax=Nitrososphaera viennensis TaxID=1034015 RepID=A0A060HPL8_9ARCH|nr:hypothetical protein [Nitrososphaera viennensis]AIC15486.1 hypothetical protein NVIE_012530 [Nitrososphaera viennensis EN76]UVS70375.1 hypothetical protein NWT39_06210 [Nitrososphaera viennensis]